MNRSILIAATAIVAGAASSAVRPAAAATELAATPTETPSPSTVAVVDAERSALDLEDVSRLIEQGIDLAKPEISALLKESMAERPDGGITYSGFVVDAASGAPVAGASVHIIRKLSRDPKTGGWRELETTKHTSSELGLYSFSIPAEQASEGSLYLEVEAYHPEYASKGRSGYSHAMIRKNLKLGELPFYTSIRLWPGEAIEGVVVSPQNRPIADVPISMYSASSTSQTFPRGSFSKTTTDADGRFRVVAPTPGDGVLWIKPVGYAPQALRLEARRGNWGAIVMRAGADITGRVVDVDGDPVVGVRVEARRRGDGEEADEFLGSNAVANQIGRTTVSDEAGEFRLAALPDGEYTLEVKTNSDSYDQPPLDQVFLRQTCVIADGKHVEIVVRAMPHVVLEGTYVDGNNAPRSGHMLTLFGRLDGDFYFGRSSVPGNDGKFLLKIPHGLREARLDLMTNEHSALRWRMSRDTPLRRGRGVRLGTVEDDLTGFEVVRYTAPILLVRAIGPDGDTVEGAKPVLTYTKPAGDDEEFTMYTTGGNVSFDEQRDGRHRSSQLLPNEPFSITFESDGWKASPQELQLDEGEEREIDIVLRRTGEE